MGSQAHTGDVCSSPIDVVSGEEFLRATADPVSVESRKMLTTFNSDKNPRLLELLCKEYAGERVKEAFMFHVDRFGFNVLAKSFEVSSLFSFFLQEENNLHGLDFDRMINGKSFDSPSPLKCVIRKKLPRPSLKPWKKYNRINKLELELWIASILQSY